jgi:hypothetical protein
MAMPDDIDELIDDVCALPAKVELNSAAAASAGTSTCLRDIGTSGREKYALPTAARLLWIG